MKTFRRISMCLAILLMAGEVWRSWGDGRHIMFILDDFFAGFFMLFAALRFTKDTPARRATFAAAWGVAVGMLYGSFFGKLLADGPINSGNWDAGILTFAIGVAFVLSLIGLVLSIKMPFKD